MSKWFCLIFCAASLVLSSHKASATTEIKWEVENRFRYLKNAADFRELAKAFNEETKAFNEQRRTAPNLSALEFEKALETRFLDGRFKSGAPVNRRLGWASTMYLNTCGKQDDDYDPHAKCKLPDGELYLEPKKTNLLVSLIEPPAGNCQFSIEGGQSKPASCADTVQLSAAYFTKQKLIVKPQGVPALSSEILVRDFVVASFGDSFSAGEGNPEQPATLSDEFSDFTRSSGTFGDIDQFPRRKVDSNFFGDSAANWTNSQCHRSLYSQHAKAALHYALLNEHASVTFVNYSCTGAEVYQGILNAWWARDVNPRYWDDAPQIVKALRDFCKDPKDYLARDWSKGDRTDENFNSKIAKFQNCAQLKERKVDALLLSIGGNDSGFGRLVANAVIFPQNIGDSIDDGLPWMYGLWRTAAGPLDFRIARSLTKNLQARYKLLGDNFDKHLKVKPTQIILTAYPDVGTDQNGAECADRTNVGMSVHRIFERKDGSSRQTTEFIKLLRQTMRANATQLSWRFADLHFEDGAPNNFKKHGLCAEDPAGDVQLSATFPQPTPPLVPPYKWTPFNPSSWKPYTVRNRWMVTPNDSYLTTNYVDREMWDRNQNDPVQPLYGATLSGSFHPNALGHAALADSVLVHLNQVLQR